MTDGGLHRMSRVPRGRRRGLALAGLTVAVLVAVIPASADTPESGGDPGVTLTVSPDDFVGNGQTVSVTGTGFPASTGGVIRQCGGSSAAPQCDLAIAATFLTTDTGDIPATSVTVKRIIDTGTTGFNCGVQACALVATAGGRTSQHHISILGAGTLVPTSSSTSTSTSSTSTTTSTIPLPPPTTVVPPALPGGVCDAVRAALEPFPFLRVFLDGVLSALGCPLSA